ncbi:unnamed protein product [Pleuronectes platessa]|uniref:Uncharacterized protein n=1 Tax=Pleuronectes platessa TaxID=8262 RepID=A0A9N7YVG2_PLEPL|nr:unnamed protein product [Pleuronectes platessa]
MNGIRGVRHQTLDKQPTQDSPSSSNLKETGGELEVKGQVGDNEEGCVSPVSQTDLLKETDEDAERTNVKVKEETKSEWTTVGLTGTMEDGQSHVPDACFIRGPVGAAEVLSCEIADALSCLMLPGCRGEDSRRGEEGELRHPFNDRGNVWRTEGLICRSEGLRLRASLRYLPGAFAAPVMAQTTIQPVDTVLLAAVKSRSEVYYPVVSTSPLLHLTHPSSQPLRRPLTVTLPCPPNPERKRDVRGRGKQTERPHSGPVAPAWDQLASSRVSGLGASLKSPKETSKELLVVLVSRDKQWSVLERVTVRNLQNGLASFELTESCDSTALCMCRCTVQLHKTITQSAM